MLNLGRRDDIGPAADRPWADLAVLAALALALFGAFFHWQILDIGNVAWLLRGSDNGENALGLHAWLHDPAPGFLHTHLLNAPEGVGLLFTDSNPLLSALAFPLRGLLPADAQLIGWWLLVCLFLQLFFAWLLLRRHAPNALALWCGVLLLAALPTLFNRIVHVNLMAHWLILWSLWRFTDPARAGSNRGWAVLIAVTAFIHSYLLVMVGAIWASAMLERLWRDRRGAQRILVECAAILAMVGGIAWSLGVFEPHWPSGNYGAFAMPLDALWNPGVETFSTFLPAIEQRPGRGFEGFQYLGLGLLILLPLAAVLARRLPRPADSPDSLARLKWLIPALVVLTLLAISTYPDFAGQRLPRFHLPQGLAIALDAVRASGRLFWPVAYVLVFAGIRILYRLEPRRAGLAIAALAAVQAADLAPMAVSIRAQSAEARGAPLYVRTASPEWDRLVAQAKDIAFVPGDVTKGLGVFQEVAWRAARAQVPVRAVYAARPSLASNARQDAETSAFRRGEVVPGRLYILIDGEPIPPPLLARARPLDGVTIVFEP
ncbi:DUF6311 domain-containing protein [Sphingomonas sp. MS122]|uniref:DUF6311 domain-containing protein n=1 Tax=Sphingomonas sp. MS122 TaxID=3412683 RepID=UPI003C2DD710